jgi:hypothetical protein
MQKPAAFFPAFLGAFLASIPAAKADLPADLPPQNARSSWFVGTGLYRTDGLGSSSAYFGASFGYQWEAFENYEVRLIVDNEYQAHDASDSRFIYYGVGVNHVCPGDYPFVVGAELGMGDAETVAVPTDPSTFFYFPDESSRGPTIALKAGYRFFAKRRFPFEIDLRATEIFLDANVFGHPKMLGLSFSVYL